MTGISETEVALRLGAAAVLGLAVGLERVRVEQPAGLRDHGLVAVGSALFMLVSAYGFDHVTDAPNVTLDPSRIAAQVVSGIGFIGAGTIVRRQNIVRGLTTAASTWAAAALGLAAGGGLFFAAGMGLALILLILAGIKSLERRISSKHRRQVMTIVAERRALSVQALQEVVNATGVRLARLDLREAKEGAEQERFDLIVVKPETPDLVQLIDALRAKEGVLYVRSTISLNGSGR